MAMQIYKNVCETATTGMDYSLANSKHCIGRCLFGMKNTPKAKALFELALQAYHDSAINANCNRDFANTTFWIGRCLLEMKNPGEAKFFFENSLHVMCELLSSSETTERDLAGVIFWIGRCFFDFKNPLKANEHFEEARNIYLKTSSDVKTDCDFADTTYWIGRSLFDSNKLEAKSAFETSLRINNKISIVSLTAASEFNCDVANSLFWIGCCLVDLKQFEESIICFEKALKIYEKLCMEVDAANSCYWIGRCMFLFEEVRKGKRFLWESFANF